MKRHMYLATTLLLASALLSTQALARGQGHGRGGHGRDGMGPRMMQMLDLSQEQQVQIEKLRAEMMAENAEVKVELEQKRKEMHQLWMADEPNEQAILAKHAEMDPLRQQMRVSRVKMRLATHKLLTPAQKQKLKTHMEKRGARGMGLGMGQNWDGDQDASAPVQGRQGRKGKSRSF